MATIRASRTGSGEAYQDIEAARQWLLNRADCTGRTGIIGFCMGGSFALLCAPRYGFQAASVNYGEVPGDAGTRLAGACPVIASYGRRDRGLRGRAARLEGVLQTLGIDHDVKEYPTAGHSFMNRLTGPELNPVLKFIGMNYDHPSAADSWRRILSFFDARLRDGSPATKETGAPTS